MIVITITIFFHLLSPPSHPLLVTLQTRQEYHFATQRIRSWRTYTNEGEIELEFEYNLDETPSGSVPKVCARGKNVDSQYLLSFYKCFFIIDILNLDCLYLN